MQHMLDPDDRHAALVDASDRLDQHAAFALGQAAGDLVEQQQSRFGRQRAGQFQPLALQEAQAPAGWLARVDQPGLDQDFGAALADLGLASCARRRRRRPAGSRTRSVSRKAAGSGRSGRRRQGSAASAAVRVTSRPIEIDGAGVGRDVAGDQVEQRRLAGAVRADDAQRLALAKLERNRIGDRQGAEPSRPSARGSAPSSANGRGWALGHHAIASILPPVGMFGAVLLSVMTRS